VRFLWQESLEAIHGRARAVALLKMAHILSRFNDISSALILLCTKLCALLLGRNSAGADVAIRRDVSVLESVSIRDDDVRSMSIDGIARFHAALQVAC